MRFRTTKILVNSNLGDTDMKNNLLFANLDIEGRSPYILPLEFLLSRGSSLDALSKFNSLVNNSLYHSNDIYVSGASVLRETFSCISKFAGSLFVRFSTVSCPILLHKLPSESLGQDYRNLVLQPNLITSGRNHFGGQFGFSPKNEFLRTYFSKLVNTNVVWIGRIWKEIEKHNVRSTLSLATAFVPPFDTTSSNTFAHSITLENSSEEVNGPLRQHISNSNKGCSTLAASNLRWVGHATEPKTGIKFPALLEDDFNLATEVLVGIGSRTMRIVKIKNLNLYAFGLYVHPDSVCQKLSPKYASMPPCELKNRSDFLQDLLREDIHMTVRLVVNCNGLKINTVRDAFEKSLRNRLQKMNPNTDYHCLRIFGSYFKEDISIAMGTTIDFRQTADGQLITEIGGKHVGAVHSKDLCRALFDMYIGDIPVSTQAKEEIAQNVAGLMRRC